MSGKRVLMVEGPDDAHVVKHISARYLDPHLPMADVFAQWLQRTFFSL